MKNRGFTLIELLAVVVLLSILIVLGTTSVAKSVKQSKQQAYDIDITSFVGIVRNWALDHSTELPTLNSYKEITLGYLINSGLVDPGKKNPLTGELYDTSMLFCIYNTNNNYRYTYAESGSCE